MSVSATIKNPQFFPFDNPEFLVDADTFIDCDYVTPPVQNYFTFYLMFFNILNIAKSIFKK